MRWSHVEETLRIHSWRIHLCSRICCKDLFIYLVIYFNFLFSPQSNREKKLKLPLLGSRIVALSEEQTGVKGAFEVRSDDNRVALLAADSPLETDDWIMCLKQAKVRLTSFPLVIEIFFFCLGDR